MKIYVGNLPFSMNEDDLRQLFEGYGQVTSADIIMDKMSGRSRGFGFIEMPDQAQGEAAIEALNSKPFKGRPLTVNEARPKEGGGRR
jgi:RNA recognition motif-containing protein